MQLVRFEERRGDVQPVGEPFAALFVVVRDVFEKACEYGLLTLADIDFQHQAVPGTRLFPYEFGRVAFQCAEDVGFLAGREIFYQFPVSES